MGNDNILIIKDLFAGYSKGPILEGVNLELRKGETCCVIGEEGSGKSTLVRAITQQIPSKGQILYNGVDVQLLSADQMTSNGIDFVVQGGNVLNGFTVEEHVSLAMSERKIGRSGIWKEIKEHLPKIPSMKKQVAGTLSGGERILLSLACILATDAEFLILDEPTAGLAPEACDDIERLLLMLKTEKQKTILLLEHNYDFAFALSDSVITLKEGKLSSKFGFQEFRQKGFVESKLYDIS